MKKLTCIFILILSLFMLFSCDESKNIEEKNLYNASYKIIEYDKYVTESIEKSIQINDYLNSLVSKKVLLLIDFIYDEELDKNKNYTFKFEYYGMDLDIYEANTSHIEIEDNLITIKYSKLVNDKSERIILLMEANEYSSVIFKYNGDELLNICINDIIHQDNFAYLITYDANGGTINSNEQVYTNGESKLLIPEKEGYYFNGWYLGSNLLIRVSDEFDFTRNVKLYASWVNNQNEVDNDSIMCKFGHYPQTKETDETVINELNTKAGTLPEEENIYNWNDYCYYIKGNKKTYMYYIDIDLDSDGVNDYRGVYFTSYRPSYCGDSSSTSNSYQDDNGYYTNTTYWFKYEPIIWDIVKIEDKKYTLVSRYLIDSQQYDYDESYNNNYEESTIRTWLNETFYNLTFTEEEKEIIQTTLVDNSVSSTGYDNNQYVCGNTNDKVFLLSCVEVNSYYTSYDNRRASGTDYAKSQGSEVSSYYTDKYGNDSIEWRLRSPGSGNGSACIITCNGGINRSYSVGCTSFGVRVSLVINP